MEAARLLRKLRTAADLSQEELARAAKLGRATVQNIELGLNAPSVRTAKALSLVLGVDWPIFFASPSVNSNKRPRKLQQAQ